MPEGYKSVLRGDLEINRAVDISFFKLNKIVYAFLIQFRSRKIKNFKEIITCFYMYKLIRK